MTDQQPVEPDAIVDRDGAAVPYRRTEDNAAPLASHTLMPMLARMATAGPVLTASALAIACVALFSSVLAYVFWNRGVEQVGANVAGLFVHLMPVFGVILAWFILDERLAPFHVAGIVLILCGIYLTSRFAPVSVPAGID